MCIWCLSFLKDKWNWNPAASYPLYYEYGRRHPYADIASQEEYLNVTRRKYFEHKELKIV